MRVIKENVDRRTIIEAYGRYDCSKKGLQAPNFEGWNWTDADTIDRGMCYAKLKTGIPAGYLAWDEVEVSIPDLRECAVVSSIFPGKAQALGILERAGELAGWKPDRPTSWYERIASGQTLDEPAPLLLRPAVRSEFPARWYVEDGSGRVTAFLANPTLFGASQTIATGYLGRVPDSNSSIMREKFPELLQV